MASLSQEERMEIFLALVKAQDDEMPVAQARTAVAARFGVSEQQVRQIEREGLEGNWPPWGSTSRLSAPPPPGPRRRPG